MKDKIKIISVAFVVLICLFCFCGCQSTDKSDSFFNYSQFEQATFEYNEETNKTKVVFNATLTNNTIYNFNSFSVRLNLYSDSNIVNIETYNYDIGVKNGDSYTGYFNFYANGKIDSIEYVSWTANYSSFWETYKIWLIVFFVLVSVASIIYVIYMIIEDTEISDVLDEIVDFLEEHAVLAMLLLIPSIGTGVWAVIKSNWIPVVIIVASVISFILIASVAHLIKYVIEEISYSCFSSFRGYDAEDEDYFDNTIENVADYIDDIDTLLKFTKEQLKEYCQINKISGYSNLNKLEIASLINSSENPKTQNRKTNIKTSSKKSNYVEDLNDLIGLESVKNQLKRIRAVLLKNKDSGDQPNLHMCFLGNPGTGKTVVARLLADIFYETGVLPTNKLVETDRSGLCGQYVGQTTPLTHKKVKEAMGGVLFIDEAYTLDTEGEDYGKEAIAALLKDMEDYKGKFCVILAGYKEEMEKMISLNPGFDSRINRKIIFPDYTIDEQMQIFDKMIAAKKYEIAEDAKIKLREIFEIKSKDKHFANARTVRNILDELIEIQAVRTIEENMTNSERIIKLDDVTEYNKGI